jgi:nucleotidyltransferase substrate binding protein (TIGR01987 family)
MKFIVDGIDVSKLIKARNTFAEFKKDMVSDRDKSGAIQAFEYCYELAWKTMKRLLDKRGKVVNSPREVFRAAALEGMIENPEAWFTFLKMRNITTHTYDEDVIDSIIVHFDSFEAELNAFIKKLGLGI